MARLFFAVSCPPHVAHAIGAVQARLREHTGDIKMTWARPEQVHCTIKFLGEEPPDRAAAAIRAGRALSKSDHPFQLTVEGLGGFPDARRPQVVWLGASGGSAELARLAAHLDDLLVPEGFDGEFRPFVPHLTLARVKSRSGSVAAGQSLEALKLAGPIATWEVRALVLMQSVSTSEGVRYTPVETFALEAK